MKKILIGFAGVLVLAVVIVLFINAGERTQGTNKVQTELKAESTKGPCVMQCYHMKVNNVKACESAKCQGTICDPEKCREVGCDPSNCQAKCEKPCIKTKACTAACVKAGK